MIDATKVACPGLPDSRAKTFRRFVQPPRYSGSGCCVISIKRRGLWIFL
jgi:hypothetical protein